MHLVQIKEGLFQRIPQTECRKLEDHETNKKEKKETDASAKQTSEATAFMASSSQPSKSWFFNTCVSAHMTSDRDIMTDIREHGGFVQMADSQHMTVTGIGKLRFQCLRHDGLTLPATLEDVLLVPGVDSKIPSWACTQGWRPVSFVLAYIPPQGKQTINDN